MKKGEGLAVGPVAKGMRMSEPIFTRTARDLKIETLHNGRLIFWDAVRIYVEVNKRILKVQQNSS